MVGGWKRYGHAEHAGIQLRGDCDAMVLRWLRSLRPQVLASDGPRYSWYVAFLFADFELREELFELRRAGQRVPVEPKALQVLIHLVRNRTRAVTRDELLGVGWAGVRVESGSLTRAIVLARRALEDEAQQIIMTVRGHGFRFAAPVVERADSPSEEQAHTAPPVGREAPLAALGAQLAGVRSGKSALAWISGIAGIGKTHLLDEVARLARAREMPVHLVRCHESPAQPSLRPWSLLLDAIAESGGPEAERAREAAARLSEPGPGMGAFGAVIRTLIALGRSRPRVLAFDDVHWADEVTLDLLRLVAREARDAGLFIVCTLRETSPTEDARSRALGSLLCEYEAGAIPLRGLSRDETARLIESVKRTAPPDALVSAIHERTAGCPLLILQILETDWARRAMDDEERTIATSIDMKRGLIDSVSRYLDGVSPACRDTLSWAAILGKTFGFALLASVTDRNADVLLDDLEEARRAHLVQPEGEGEYRFVHPLGVDVLEKRLSGSERAVRHAAVARALEVHYASALDLHAARIARHFVRAAPAGTAREAFQYSARAARHAAASGDLRAAAKHWTRAMRVLDLVPGSEPERLEALVALARTYTRSGDVTRARTALEDASMLARALGQPDALNDASLS
jgi:DNA-binding winged helix-turn-helix (wHTH) protein